MTFSFQRLWNAIALRLGIRKSGLLRLRRDVRSCEYTDIQVMWEILQRNEAEQARSSPGKTKKRPYWKFFRLCMMMHQDNRMLKLVVEVLVKKVVSFVKNCL